MSNNKLNITHAIVSNRIQLDLKCLPTLMKQRIHSILCCELLSFDSFSTNIWLLKASFMSLLSNVFTLTEQVRYKSTTSM